MERWLCDSTVPCSNQCTADRYLTCGHKPNVSNKSRSI
ncbi:hypothetical protein T02_729 [Trichinella nativa]|uniref:Uncharacterized protein n=1 Tax=Trichinella nativa TaxID=6335 RepID=A0A0V1KH91_9BILA|nr:hypothetical protein T02_729 [Trichinella nativa]